MEVVDFFQAAIRAFKQYPSFSILAASGIVPSNSTTYNLADLQAAFISQTGYILLIRSLCQLLTDRKSVV